MPEWMAHDENRRRMALEGLYLTGLKLREAKRRGLDSTSQELIADHIIVMCESAGLRESKLTASEQPKSLSSPPTQTNV